MTVCICQATATWAGFDSGSRDGYDEAYVRHETDLGSIRAGRLRTSFGFSDWSENFYTGFNHKPLVREMTLVGSTQLDRDDTGVEGTLNLGRLQVQGALLDVAPTKAELRPHKLDHASVTAQYAFGQLIAGVDCLSQTDGSQRVSGANLRYTLPHWIFKGEYFEGLGPNSGAGGYVTRHNASPRSYGPNWSRNANR